MELLNSLKLALWRFLRPTVYVNCQVLPGGKLPAKKHGTDAGFDLFATEDVEITNQKVDKHPLNIRLALPPGTFMEICTKSGLGSKGQLVYAGIVDEEYRGIPHVITTNLKNVGGLVSAVNVKKGEKLAQGIIHPHGPRYVMRQVPFVSEETGRGTGGFGSTGK